MLESIIDDIIDQHWEYDDRGVYTFTDARGVTGDIERRSYDLAVSDNNNLYITPRPPRDGPVLATVTYDNKPVLDVKKDTQARIEYNAHPTYQDGLLHPAELTVEHARIPLLSHGQVKNAIAGLHPQETRQHFRDGLTTVHLQHSDDPSGTAHTVHATYHGLRVSPDKENYDIIVQGMTRPHGEYPLDRP